MIRSEVERFEKVDLTKKEDGKNLELARDIFLVGVWTAQRVSDYNNLKPDIRNGSGHRHRSVAVGTDPQRDGRGKPAECLCPDDAPASMAVGYFTA